MYKVSVDHYIILNKVCKFLLQTIWSHVMKIINIVLLSEMVCGRRVLPDFSFGRKCGAATPTRTRKMTNFLTTSSESFRPRRFSSSLPDQTTERERERRRRRCCDAQMWWNECFPEWRGPPEEKIFGTVQKSREKKTFLSFQTDSNQAENIQGKSRIKVTKHC